MVEEAADLLGPEVADLLGGVAMEMGFLMGWALAMEMGSEGQN